MIAALVYLPKGGKNTHKTLGTLAKSVTNPFGTVIT